MVPISAFFRNSPPPLATILSRSGLNQHSHERVGGPIISDPTGKCSGSPDGEYSDPPCLPVAAMVQRDYAGDMATGERRLDSRDREDDNLVQLSPREQKGSRMPSESNDEKTCRNMVSRRLSSYGKRRRTCTNMTNRNRAYGFALFSR